MRNYYEILQVSPNAEGEVIQAAYKRLALKHHPDRNAQSPESGKEMRNLNEAYEILSDPSRREAYDLEVKRVAASTSGAKWIEASCPHCLRLFALPSAEDGLLVRCPFCEKLVRLKDKSRLETAIPTAQFAPPLATPPLPVFCLSRIWKNAPFGLA